MDIKITKIGFEALLQPSLTFYDKKSSIGNKIWNKVYPDWETDGLRIIFKDIKEKEVCILEHKRISLIKETPGGLKEGSYPVGHFITALSAYVKEVGLKKIERLGIRTMGFFPVEMKFVELVQLLQPKLYPPKESELYKITGTAYSDVSFAAIFKRGSTNMRFQLGPVKKDELLVRSQLRLLPLNVEELPEVSLFLDVDCFSVEVDISKFELLISDAIKNTVEVSNKILKYCLP